MKTCVTKWRNVIMTWQRFIFKSKTKPHFLFSLNGTNQCADNVIQALKWQIDLLERIILTSASKMTDCIDEFWI